MNAEITCVYDVPIVKGWYLVELENMHWAYINEAEACFVSFSAIRRPGTRQILSHGVPMPPTQLRKIESESDVEIREIEDVGKGKEQWHLLLVVDEYVPRGCVPTEMGYVEQVPADVAMQNVRVQTFFNRSVLEPMNLQMDDVAHSLPHSREHEGDAPHTVVNQFGGKMYQRIRIYCK